jgi:TPR repeat protein
VLQFVDKPKAFQLLQELVQARYPAAYDNLGGMYLWEKRDSVTAVSLFRKGVEADDADSMVSLADMIDKGQAMPLSPNETKIELYARAARLGHKEAAQAYQTEQQNERTNEQRRSYEINQQRQMLELFGGLLQNFPRR